MPTAYDYRLMAWQDGQRQRAEQEAMRQARQQEQQQMALLADAQRAESEATAANEGRFWAGLEALGLLRNRSLDSTNQWGDSLIADTNRRYDIDLKNSRTEAFNRGMGGSPTILASLANRNQDERGRALNRTNDLILQNRVAADERNTNNVIGFLERRSDVYPDRNATLTLAQQMGRFGGTDYRTLPGGGGGYAPPANGSDYRTLPGGGGSVAGGPPSYQFPSSAGGLFNNRPGTGMAPPVAGGDPTRLPPPGTAWQGGHLVPLPGVQRNVGGYGRPTSTAASYSPMPLPPPPAPRMLGPNLNDPANYAALNHPARTQQNAQNLYMNYRGASPRPDIAGMEAQGITGVGGLYQAPTIPGMVGGPMGAEYLVPQLNYPQPTGYQYTPRGGTRRNPGTTTAPSTLDQFYQNRAADASGLVPYGRPYPHQLVTPPVYPGQATYAYV